MVITNTSTLRITINLASQRAVQPNSPPSLSLSFNAFCSKAQVKMLFVSEWNHVCHCFPVAQGEKGQGDDAPRCQIASKGVETESRSERDVKESPLWRRWKSCRGGEEELEFEGLVTVSAPPAQVAEDEVVPDVHPDQVGRVERGTVPSRSWHLL